MRREIYILLYMFYTLPHRLEFLSIILYLFILHFVEVELEIERDHFCPYQMSLNRKLFHQCALFFPWPLFYFPQSLRLYHISNAPYHHTQMCTHTNTQVITHICTHTHTPHMHTHIYTCARTHLFKSGLGSSLKMSCSDPLFQPFNIWLRNSRWQIGGILGDRIKVAF